MRQPPLVPTISLALAVLASGGCGGGEDVATADVAGVEFRETLRLDFEGAPTAPAERGLVARNGAGGRVAFVDRNVPYEILLFDEDGTWTGRLGAQGAGPGEYDEIGAIAFDPRGRLWAVSRGGTRADVYTPDLELDRTMTLERSVATMRPLGDVPLLVLTRGPDGPAVAYLRDDGTLEPRGIDLPPDADRQVVAVATDGSERYWVSTPHRFSILAGRRDGAWTEMELEEPAWFADTYPADVQEEFGEMLDTRGATILALEYDATEDVLWLTAGVPSPEVDAARLRAAFAEGDPEALAELPALLVDHVVTGLDPETGTRVAEGRFDVRPVSLGSALQYEMATDDIVALVRPTLLR